MNLYCISEGETRYFASKIDAMITAQDEADATRREITVTKVFVAVDRANIVLLANQKGGFTKFVGRIATVQPRRRPKVKFKKIAAVTILFLLLMLPNLAEAASCTTRRSGSVSVTSCSGRGFTSHCRSYRSGGVIKTYCR